MAPKLWTFTNKNCGKIDDKLISKIGAKMRTRTVSVIFLTSIFCVILIVSEPRILLTPQSIQTGQMLQNYLALTDRWCSKLIFKGSVHSYTIFSFIDISKRQYFKAVSYHCCTNLCATNLFEAKLVHFYWHKNTKIL